MKWNRAALRPLAERLVGSTDTTTAVFVRTDQVPQNELWLLDFAALYNQSGESITAQWVILEGSRVIFISADLTVADGDAVASTELPTLREGERFAARAVGTAKLGMITLVVSGVRLPELATIPREPAVG